MSYFLPYLLLRTLAYKCSRDGILVNTYANLYGTLCYSVK